MKQNKWINPVENKKSPLLINKLLSVKDNASLDSIDNIRASLTARSLHMQE